MRKMMSFFYVYVLGVDVRDFLIHMQITGMRAKVMGIPRIWRLWKCSGLSSMVELAHMEVLNDFNILDNSVFIDLQVLKPALRGT